MFGSGVALDFACLDGLELFDVDEVQHHLPIITVVLHGPVFSERGRADASLVFDSFTVVEHVAVRW